MARFGFDNMEDLPIGKTVAFAISGEDHERYGKVKDVHLLSAAGAEVSANSDARGLNNQGSVADVIVTIEPRESLDPSLINRPVDVRLGGETLLRSEEHTSELQSLMRISYAVFCLQKKTILNQPQDQTSTPLNSSP